ncbi:MAG: hypothetical protein ACI9GB_003603 [Halioglobus sp.]|jgi:hypothetical protein
MSRFRLTPIFSLAVIAALTVPYAMADGSTPDPVGIYEDHLNDAELNSKNPTRIRLAKSSKVKLGRIGGVWGALGGDDLGDSFFVGKTPDLTNLQISMRTPADSPTVRYVIKGTSGQDVTSFDLESVSGENLTQWISIKGKITIELLANSTTATNYALYIWYPGGSLDSLNKKEIAEIASGDFAEKPTIYRAPKRD